VKVTYSKLVDAAYIYLDGEIDTGGVAKTTRVGRDILLDFDKAGRLIGIELLSGKLLPKRLLESAVEP
jgi:uncharacterized protein YuzE